MRSFTAEFSLRGTADISERCPDPGGAEDRYGSIKLIEDHEIEKLEVVFDVEPDDDGNINADAKLTLCVRSFHMLNKETGRAFHASFDIEIYWWELKELRRLLTYLLTLIKEDR